MHQTYHLFCKHTGSAVLRCFIFFFFQGVDLANAREVKNFQEAVNVGIRSVDRTGRFVRAWFLWIQPDCAAFGFTDLVNRFGDQRNSQMTRF